MIKLADCQDLEPGRALIINLPDGREIALFNSEGIIYALDNACPHMGGPLGEGEFEKGVVICPWHGWQFELASGKCMNMPGEDALKVAIEVRDGAIFLQDP